MNIINHKTSPNFGSIYKYNITKNNLNQGMDATGELSELELKDNGKNIIYENYVPYKEACKTGIYQNVHICAEDKHDTYIESILKQYNINFIKQSKEDALKPENIYNRTVLPKNLDNEVLTSLDTKKIDELFKKTPSLYISKNGISGTINNRYQEFQDYLKTGMDIEATHIVLNEANGKLNFSIVDGRHRFAVMRDMGMDKIKFALDENSLKLAEKYGLIKE